MISEILNKIKNKKKELESRIEAMKAATKQRIRESTIGEMIMKTRIGKYLTYDKFDELGGRNVSYVSSSELLLDTDKLKFVKEPKEGYELFLRGD